MDDFQKLLNLSYNFLSYRPRSEKEVRNKLRKKVSDFRFQISEEDKDEVINKVISKLKEQKFLDDAEFAKWWIEQRTRIKPRAWRFIQYELKRKGISEDIIDSQITNPESQIPNDLEVVLELAKKRLPRYVNEEPQKRYEKMMRFLASKGFSYDIIREVIDQILPKRYNSDR